MTKQNGYSGLFTPYVWMFIQSYEKLRRFLYEQCSIESLIQYEYSAFEEATVPVCSFVFCNMHTSNKKGCYLRLTKFRGGMEVQRVKTVKAIEDHNCGFYYEQNSEKFASIPGAPVSYWASDSIYQAFKVGTLLGKMAYPRQGMATTNNNMFLRLWFEVSIGRIGLDCLMKNRR